jgi:hypothetical protein
MKDRKGEEEKVEGRERERERERETMTTIQIYPNSMVLE